MVSKKIFSTAGTPEVLNAASLLSTSFLFENPKDQTGDIRVSDSSASLVAGVFHTLIPGEKFTIQSDAQGGGQMYEFDLSDIWGESTVDGEALIISRLGLGVL